MTASSPQQQPHADPALYRIRTPPKEGLFPEVVYGFLVFLWLGKELMGARHNPRLAHACTELTALFFFFYKRRSRDGVPVNKNKKARRGLVHRVSSVIRLLFHLSLSSSFASSLCLALSGLTGLPTVDFNRPHFVMRIYFTIFLGLVSPLACLVALCLNRMAFFGSDLAVLMYTSTRHKIEAHSEDRGLHPNTLYIALLKLPPIRLVKLYAAVCNHPIKLTPEACCSGNRV